MKSFLYQLFLRVVIMAAVLAFWATIHWPKDFYVNIPKGTSYGKLSWIYNAMNSARVGHETSIFLGSSICLNSVNDSLMNALDTTGADYVNLGLPHTCFALGYEVLEEMVERGIRPKKVYLCLKSDAMAIDIHKMYPLVADAGDMLESIPEGNVLALQSLMKRMAWNQHYWSRAYKFHVLDSAYLKHSNYGFRPLVPRDSVDVEKYYSTYAAVNSKQVEVIEKMQSGEGGDWRLKVQLARLDWFNNAYFQRESVRKSMALLEKMQIDFDVIMYPNLVLQRQGRSQVMQDYFHAIFPEIRAHGHRLIVLDGPYLLDASKWNDTNHLNSRGANLFTRELLSKL